MARQAVRRVERAPAHRVRDGLIMLVIAFVLALAVFGLVSVIALLSGVSVGGSSTAPSAQAPQSKTIVLERARQKATLITNHAHAALMRERRRIITTARAEARQIVRTANHKAHGGGQSHTTRPVATQPPAVVPPARYPVPATRVPTSPPASRGRKFPRFQNVPKSWTVLAYGADPGAGTVNVANRGRRAFSGTVTVTYFGTNGNVAATRTGYFTNVPSRGTIVVAVGSPPLAWTRYQVSVSGVH